MKNDWVSCNTDKAVLNTDKKPLVKRNTLLYSQHLGDIGKQLSEFETRLAYAKQEKDRETYQSP